MERVRGKIAENRAHTDASLVAERASTDAANHRTSTKAQDDLLERDRVVEDERLLKFRENADSTLARERLESTAPDRSVAPALSRSPPCRLIRSTSYFVRSKFE
jgi:hypothetical protein